MASANDMFQKVGRATATTLSAPGYTTGDSSVNIGSTTNWPTDTGVTFAIDVVDAAGERIAGTYNVFRGRVAGASQVDQVVYEGGDAHRSYPSGATTRVYILVSSYRDNRMADGLMISHNQDGTIKGPSVVTALTGQTLPANTVTTPAITDASVTPAAISDEAVSGAKIANTTIPDIKLLNGKVKHRQGGSPSNWSTVGTTNYNTSAENVKIQVGSVYNNASVKTITFPEAFTQPPIVLAQVASVNVNACFVVALSATATNFACQVYTNAGAANNAQDVRWIAIGV